MPWHCLSYIEGPAEASDTGEVENESEHSREQAAEGSATSPAPAEAEGGRTEEDEQTSGFLPAAAPTPDSSISQAAPAPTGASLEARSALQADAEERASPAMLYKAKVKAAMLAAKAFVLQAMPWEAVPPLFPAALANVEEVQAMMRLGARKKGCPAVARAPVVRKLSGVQIAAALSQFAGTKETPPCMGSRLHDHNHNRNQGHDASALRSHSPSCGGSLMPHALERTVKDPPLPRGLPRRCAFFFLRSKGDRRWPSPAPGASPACAACLRSEGEGRRPCPAFAASPACAVCLRSKGEDGRLSPAPGVSPAPVVWC
ncbi:hypothetical protein FOA52_004191 [Chlamydomonas sp. UWO 241]|nr:hypothetical protein FOA52_004191 [Chlamydomonas sp. UWO 241]